MLFRDAACCQANARGTAKLCRSKCAAQDRTTRINSQGFVYLLGIGLACGIFVLMKWLSHGRVVLNYFTAEGIVVGIFAVGCFIVAYMTGGL